VVNRPGKAPCWQEEALPVFVREGETKEQVGYRYCGLYKVLDWNEEPHPLSLWSVAAKNRKDDVGRVIFLKKPL
jgi:hypothetical protein